MGNLPINGNLSIEAKGIPNIGWSNSQYRLQDLPVVGIAMVFTLASIVCTYNHITVHSGFYQLIIIFNILGILYIYSENSLVAFMLHNMPCIFSKGIEKCQKLTTWDTFRQECVESLPVKKAWYYGNISWYLFPRRFCISKHKNKV